MARRTRAQIARALTDLEKAVRFAREVQEEHADHPHYNGVCFHTNVDTRDGQIICRRSRGGGRLRERPTARRKGRTSGGRRGT